MSLDEARALGYEPRDDAEVFAAGLIAEHGEPDPADPAFGYLGGEFCQPDFDADRLDPGRLDAGRLDAGQGPAGNAQPPPGASGGRPS